MLFHFGLEDSLATRPNYDGANLAAALKNSHDSGFVFAASSGDAALSFTQVHVSRLATDKSFVGLNFATATT
jgi:hypothetical protein